jgi:cobalt/nickel transport system permease protein
MMIPSFLLKKQAWSPSQGGDHHIDKTILSLTSVLSLFREEHLDASPFLRRPSAFLKLLATLILVVLLSLSRNYAFVLLVDGFAFFLVGLLGAREIRKVLTLSFVALLFFALILSFSFLKGNYNNVLLLCGKAAGTVMLVNLMAFSTSSRRLTEALRVFSIPDIMIFTLDITLKYIVVLGHIATEMLLARKIRSPGRDRRSDITLSRTMGILYMKSREYSDALYAAMDCRGFNGKYRKEIEHKFSAWDLAYGITHGFIVFFYFYLIK